MSNIVLHLSAIIAVMLLSACAAISDMQGIDPVDYYAAHPIENKAGPNGELISPEHCPDWRTSPTTTFSNTMQSNNRGCSTVTNLGLMLEDPRDAVRGASAGHVSPKNSDHALDAVRNYRTQLADGPISSDPSGGAADAANATASAATGQ